jgi:ATP-dependent exoDNAse (exonuclease V) beta subunit
VQPREPNFFSDFGTLNHDVLERFFTGELEDYELSQYFLSNYKDAVKTPAPPSYSNPEQRYFDEGQHFFDNFSFNKGDYDVLVVEDKIDFEIGNIMVVAKPDLVLREKANNKYILYDYKTAMPFKTDRNGKETVDKEKIEGYKKQMFIYAYALRNHRSMPIEEINIWFTRADRIHTIPWSSEEEEASVGWFVSTVKSIRDDETFVPNNTNPYFCNNLCGVRNFCEYKI